MRILMVNTVYAVGSTGKIVNQIAQKAEKSGAQCMIAHRYENKEKQYLPNVVPVGSWLDCHIHNRLSQMFMLRGVFSRWKTFLFLKKVTRYNPDIIHLHNISGNFINDFMLFRYIKKHRIKVIWTFHDCWPLTGYCKYFDMAGCDRWQNGCGHCLQRGRSLVDLSALMYKRKQKMFSGIQDMTIVTPSNWLAGLVQRSPLRIYPIKVINNGIDLGVFKPTNSCFRKEHGLEGKKVVLGVSFAWGERKGLDVFITLAYQLPKDYRIVLVGTTDEIDKRLPTNIISIHRTNNQQELAAIYTAADVFVNPTREDNYPTVNMEALACGTPVITFRTGGSPEMIDGTCGFIVERDDEEMLKDKIIEACENRPFSREACCQKSQTFDMNDRFDEYVQLYKELA